MSMRTYVSKQTLKARKVTDKDGESVVTGLGPVSAPKGSYVAEDNEGNFFVVEGAAFEALWKPRSAPSKRPAAKRSTPKPASKTASASTRVKAAASKTGK